MKFFHFLSNTRRLKKEAYEAVSHGSARLPLVFPSHTCKGHMIHIMKDNATPPADALEYARVEHEGREYHAFLVPEKTQ